MTPLDEAQVAMDAGGEEERLLFWERFAATELYLLLDREALDGTLKPRVFPLDDGPVALAFDSEERLAAFAGAAPFAALPGRDLARMAAGAGLALGLNLDVAPSATVLPAAALRWLADLLRDAPAPVSARPQEIGPPDLPPAFVEALTLRLAEAAPLAGAACLVSARHDDGRRSHLLAFLDAAAGSDATLAALGGEAAALSGLAPESLDIAVLPSGDPAAGRLAGAGLLIDLRPEAEAARPGPGRDPDRPPRLR